jgi:hypothetical protein
MVFTGAALACAFACGGCAGTSSGQHTDVFFSRAAWQAYIPLHGSRDVILDSVATATVIAPGIAVTAAHAANLVPGNAIIGRSADYDLLFFRTDRQVAPPLGRVKLGAVVTAYGRGEAGDVREAAGPVRAVDAPMTRECDGCAPETVMMYEAQAGRGFSGGPVFDRQTARLVGITFGYKDGIDPDHPEARVMYAYGMDQVFQELRKAEAGAEKVPSE